MAKQTEVTPGVGADIGTMNVVAARKTASGIETRRVRDAFLELPLDSKKMLKLANVSYVERADELLILGDAAMDTANIFGREARRPLSAGLVSSSDVDAMEILGLLIKNVLGEPKVPNEHCYFSVPAAPVDKPGQDVIYHRGVLEKIVRECGYTPTAGNEAMAIVYAETAKEGFSGIGISFGSGMTNCLSGDTKVPLLDGTEKTMEELANGAAGETFWVYSSTPEGQIVPGLAHHPRQTGVQPVLRVHLDDGTHFDCTRDHRVMLRDGCFLEAGDLAPGTSLMPLYRSESKFKHNSYRSVWDHANKRRIPEHRLIAEALLGRPLEIGPDREVVHHRNFKGLDNRPENLQIMRVSEHRALHDGLSEGNRARTKGKTYEEIYGAERGAEIRMKHKNSINRPGTKAKIKTGALIGASRSAAISRGKPRSGSFKEWSTSSEGARVLSTNGSLGGIVTGAANRGKTWEELYGPERAAAMKALMSKRCKGVPRGTRAPVGLRCENNHKVVRIEDLGVSVPVYDLTVDEHHNFALSCGVFVHNCALAVNTIEGLSFSVGRGGDWIDQGAAKALGSTASRMCAIKEKGITLGAPVGREQEALEFYFRNLIEYAIDQIALQFASVQGRFTLPKPVPIVVSGGTSKAGGFLELFKSVFDRKRKRFPIEVSEIRAATDPLNAVANGLLIQAMQESE